MVKLLLGTLALVGVLGLVACPIVDPVEALTPQCPAKITIGSGNVYSATGCWVKVGSSLTIEASSSHPLVGSTDLGYKALVTDAKTADYTFMPSAQDVTKFFGFQCQVHGSSGMKGFVFVSAMK